METKRLEERLTRESKISKNKKNIPGQQATSDVDSHIDLRLGRVLVLLRGELPDFGGLPTYGAFATST